MTDPVSLPGDVALAEEHSNDESSSVVGDDVQMVQNDNDTVDGDVATATITTADENMSDDNMSDDASRLEESTADGSPKRPRDTVKEEEDPKGAKRQRTVDIPAMLNAVLETVPTSATVVPPSPPTSSHVEAKVEASDAVLFPVADLTPAPTPIPINVSTADVSDAPVISAFPSTAHDSPEDLALSTSSPPVSRHSSSLSTSTAAPRSPSPFPEFEEKSPKPNHRPKGHARLVSVLLRFLLIGGVWTLFFKATQPETPANSGLSGPTLRQYLSESNYTLAFAPSYFGFFSYFGASAALERAGGLLHDTEGNWKVDGAVGASAGAMAATALATGMGSDEALRLACGFAATDFFDVGGVGGILRGNKFEAILSSIFGFSPDGNKLEFEHLEIPCAVTTFDLSKMRGMVLSQSNGISVAQAVRASATFPLLFAPVLVKSEIDGTKRSALLLDGGLADPHGTDGIRELPPVVGRRVVRITNGRLMGGAHSGLSGLADVASTATVELIGVPKCGVTAIGECGRVAAEAARCGLMAALDQPMVGVLQGDDVENALQEHWHLRIEAGPFVEAGGC